MNQSDFFLDPFYRNIERREAMWKNLCRALAVWRYCLTESFFELLAGLLASLGMSWGRVFIGFRMDLLLQFNLQGYALLSGWQRLTPYNMPSSPRCWMGVWLDCRQRFHPKKGTGRTGCIQIRDSKVNMILCFFLFNLFFCKTMFCNIWVQISTATGSMIKWGKATRSVLLLGKASARVARLALGFGIGRDPTWGVETRARCIWRNILWLLWLL